MRASTTRLTHQAAIMAACLYGAILLGGCASGGAQIGNDAGTDTPPYKHMLSVTGDMAAQMSALIQGSDSGDAFLVSEVPTAHGLKMQLQLTIETQKNQNSKPALAGKLMRQSITPLYTLRYTLLGVDGKMLSAEDVSHSGIMREVYLPQLDMALMQPNAVDKKILAEKLMNKILPSIQSQPWKTTVLEQLQLTHVAIIGGQNMGISYGDIFQTEDAPRAILQVVTFEITSNGQPRTILRLIEGRLPVVGRGLIPTIQ